MRCAVVLVVLIFSLSTATGHYVECIKATSCILYRPDQIVHSYVNTESLVFALGSLILLLTASINPKMTRYKDREVAMKSAIFNRSDSTCERMAEAGFMPDQDSITCFHCNCKLRASSTTNFWEAHARVSPGCYFVKLWRALRNEPSMRNSISSDAVRYLKAYKKLSEDLQNQILKSAEDFGFSRKEVAFAVARFFMQNKGTSPKAPGDIIKLIYDNRDLYPQGLIEEIDIEELIKSILRLPVSANQRAPVSTDSHAAESYTGDSTAPKPASTSTLTTTASNNNSNVSREEMESDKCILCGVNLKNRLLLPCGHLLHCDRCLESQQVGECPRCHSAINAVVVTYIS